MKTMSVAHVALKESSVHWWLPFPQARHMEFDLKDATHHWRVWGFFDWVDRNKWAGCVFNLSDNTGMLHSLWKSKTVTWLKAKCFSKGETLTTTKHHLFLINYQNGIWFFSKHSRSTLYLLISSKKLSLPSSRNLVIWKVFCRQHWAESLLMEGPLRVTFPTISIPQDELGTRVTTKSIPCA